MEKSGNNRLGYWFLFHHLTVSVPFHSSWRMIHKGTTPFGPILTLSLVVEESPPSTPPSIPPYLPSPPHSSPPPPPVSNEDLLKSIGFLPSNRMENEGFMTSEAPKPLDLLPPYPLETPHEGGHGEFSHMVPQEGSMDGSVKGSTDQLLQTFEFVEDPPSVVSLSSSGSLAQLSTQPPPEGTVPCAMYMYCICTVQCNVLYMCNVLCTCIV